jgi:hypothetical protein
MQRRSAGWIRRSTLHPPWNECHRLPPLYYTPIISTIVLLEEAERNLGRSHDREAHGRPPKGRHFACMVSVSRPPHGWIHLGKVTSRASCIRGRRWLRLHRHGAVSFSAILRPKPGTMGDARADFPRHKKCSQLHVSKLHVSIDRTLRCNSE